jgi:hypothetical protein
MTARMVIALVAILAFGQVSAKAQTPPSQLSPSSSVNMPPPVTGSSSTSSVSSSDNQKPQEQAGWYKKGLYSFNLINIEYYDLLRKDLHFSGQRQDLRNEWTGLADTLRSARSMGFVEIDNKFVNLRNLSSILSLGSDRGGSLTFRDGATLQVSSPELDLLIRVTR